MKKISNSICKNIFFNQLRKIKYGSITIVDDKKKHVFGQDRKLSSTIFVRNDSFYFDVLIGGSIGAADSFIQNTWETNNLTNVIRIMAINSELTESIESSFNLVVSPILRFLHYLRRNNKKNSLQNIAKHYDLSNNFFSKFLDPTMMYSSAIYDGKKDTLNNASINKLKIICEKLKLQKTDHVIEIGSGWGGFAIYAATHYGCKITTTTISKQQFLYTKNKINKLKLNKKIKVIFNDYRDLQGSVD